MLLAVTQAEWITGAVALFFILIAVLALLRTLLGHPPKVPRRLRVGVFMERDAGDQRPGNEPPEQKESP